VPVHRGAALPVWAWVLTVIEAGVLVGVGTVSHVSDLLRAGWYPYPGVPVWLNLYWDSLAVADLLVAILMLCRRRAGVYLAGVVMVSDVVANWFSVCVLGGDELVHAGGVLRLIAFGLLVLCTAPFLLHELRRSTGPS
jgi:hypothetical protein